VVVEDRQRRVLDEVHVPRPDVAGVVDQHVDAAPPLDDGGHRRAERGPVEQVGGHDERPGAGLLHQRGGRRQAPGQRARVRPQHGGRVLPLLALGDRARREGDVEAGTGQVDGDALADPPAGAGDERDLAIAHRQLVRSVTGISRPSTFSTAFQKSSGISTAPVPGSTKTVTISDRWTMRPSSACQSAPSKVQPRRVRLATRMPRCSFWPAKASPSSE
jgi:hypothetical protein